MSGGWVYVMTNRANGTALHRRHQRHRPSRLGAPRRAGERLHSALWPQAPRLHGILRGHSRRHPARKEPQALFARLEGPIDRRGQPRLAGLVRRPQQVSGRRVRPSSPAPLAVMTGLVSVLRWHLLNCRIPPARRHRPAAVKRLRRSSTSLRSPRGYCVGAMGRLAIKAFGVRNRLRPAGLRRARFVYGAPSRGIEAIILMQKDYNTPCCRPRDGL